MADIHDEPRWRRELEDTVRYGGRYAEDPLDMPFEIADLVDLAELGLVDAPVAVLYRRTTFFPVSGSWQQMDEQPRVAGDLSRLA